MTPVPITAEYRDKVLKALGTTTLFGSLTTLEHSKVIDAAALMSFDTGEPITSENDPSDYIYILVDGNATVSVQRRDGKSFDIGSMRPPESLGEVGLLLDESRTASVRAATPVLALKFERSTFEEMFDTIPGFGLAIAQGLAYRLQLLSHQVAITEYDRARLGLALQAVTPSASDS